MCLSYLPHTLSCVSSILNSGILVVRASIHDESKHGNNGKGWTVMEVNWQGPAQIWV